MHLLSININVILIKYVFNFTCTKNLRKYNIDYLYSEDQDKNKDCDYD